MRVRWLGWPQVVIPAPTRLELVFAIWPASTPPDAFGKLAPANGAVHQSTIPSLTWTASQYAAEQAYCYDTSDNDVCDTSWKAGGTRADLSGLSKGTTYYWQVRAANSADTVYADSGAWWSFTTVGDADLNHWTGKAAGEVHDPQLRPLILCDPHEAGFLRETRLRGVPRAWAAILILA